MKGQIGKVESNQHYKNEVNKANARMVEVRMEKMQQTPDLGERYRRIKND